MIGRRRPWPRAVACVFSVSLFSLSFDLQETKKKTPPIIQVLFNLPLYFQAVRLETATQAGGRLLVPSLAGTFAGVSTSIIISCTGWLFDTLALGNCLLVIGTVMFCLMPLDIPPWAYFVFLIPVTLGSGFLMPSTLMSILATSPHPTVHSLYGVCITYTALLTNFIQRHVYLYTQIKLYTHFLIYIHINI